jgi:hypothetical protein
LSPRYRLSLDGQWQFRPATEPTSPIPCPPPAGQASSITVPAPWQADPRFRDHIGAAWYYHSFDLPAEWLLGRAVILGFGAVDYYAEVWVNDQKVGENEGGYLPFEVDITTAANPGLNYLAVRVEDPLETFPEVPHGKQSWYGMLSGIWQSVWVESRSPKFIRSLRVRDLGERVQVDLDLNGALTPEEMLRFEVIAPDGLIVARQDSRAPQVSLPVAQPLLWDLDTPYLYQLRASLIDTLKPAQTLDSLTKSFGFRTIGSRDGQIWLNGRPIYLRAALDQDYYPEGLCTPPSLAYIEDQFRQAKAMGLNCLRLHIKIPDPRYYQAADRLGLLIWSELPNWIQLSEAAKCRVRTTLTGMVQRDGHHPSIIIWTIINESWGLDLSDSAQRAWLAESYDFLRQLDPTRLVVGNSPCWGNFHVVTDLEDFHMYQAMPDHYTQWRDWVANFASRPAWTFAREYRDNAAWREFQRDPWNAAPAPLAPEARRRGDEPLLVSEFGNWGLPDVEKLIQGYKGEPWWFETGLAWGDGVVYPHGVQQRFREYHFDSVFPSLSALAEASQRAQFAALKYQIEQIRRHASLQGYVITEFTDLHWECNGLLDMLRNPKAHFEALRQLNADDLLIPDWQRQVYWAGERCEIELMLSHYSGLDLAGSRVTWQVEGWPELGGSFEGLQPLPATVTEVGSIGFSIPPVARIEALRVRFSWIDRRGQMVTTNSLDLTAFPRGLELGLGGAAPREPVYAPELAANLGSLGFQTTETLAGASLAIVTTLTDELREYLLAGGRVLWLAESDESLQAHLPGVGIRARRGSVWQGDWASSFGWHRFTGLPGGSVIDFAFAGLTPEHVITGFAGREFAQDVFAGLFVGWLHKPVPLIARRRVGRGMLLISTLRLAQNLITQPLAALVFRQLLALISSSNPETTWR